MQEIEAEAIANGDSDNPIQVTVVVSADNSFINGVVGLNPDWTLI